MLVRHWFLTHYDTFMTVDWPQDVPEHATHRESAVTLGQARACMVCYQAVAVVAVGISLAVGRLTLDQLGQVRILDPQPLSLRTPLCALLSFGPTTGCSSASLYLCRVDSSYA